MVVTAVQVGFSAALGAFVMGSILGETTEKERIEKLLHPVRDLFSAIFFVSVGMLMDPHTLIERPFFILGLAVLVVVGKIFFATTGTLLSGQPVRSSVFAGLSLTQIGEFSFIIAALGVSLKIIDSSLSSTIVAVSVLTTFTTPYLLRHRETLAGHIEKWIPDRFENVIHQYLRLSVIIKASSEWKGMMRSYFLKIFLNSIVIIFIFLLTSRFASHSLLPPANGFAWKSYGILLLTLLVCLPFFWGIIFAKSNDPRLASLIQTQMSQRFRQNLLLFRMMLALVLLGALVGQFLSYQYALFISLGLFAVLLLSLSKIVGPIYIWFENRFLRQLKENAEQGGETRTPYISNLTPWEAHLSDYVIPAEADFIGRSLVDLKLGERFGVIVTQIQRGSLIILAPGRDETLMPLDRVSVIGSDEQLESFEEFLDSSSRSQLAATSPENYTLEHYLVTDSSPFLNKAIRDAKIRELTKGLIVGIERGENRILSPDSNTMILLGDLLWVVGDRNLIRAL
jgi:CPA2 family monovalent cation:H+ antiporter-2